MGEIGICVCLVRAQTNVVMFPRRFGRGVKRGSHPDDSMVVRDVIEAC